jgi:carboxypeptidase Q
MLLDPRFNFPQSSKYSVLLVVLMLFLTSGPAMAAETTAVSLAEAQARIIAAAQQDGFALEWLELLCDTIGPRLTGSDEMDDAIAYAKTTMEEAGLDKVWTEPVMVPQWRRGSESAHITSPVKQQLLISGLGGSIGTGADGIEAEILVVRGEEELVRRSAEAMGKIVVFNPVWQGYGSVVKYRGAGASLAAEHGAVAALVRSATNTSLATPHTGIMSYQEGIPKIPAAALTVEDAARLHRMTDRGIAVKVKLYMEAKNLPDREQANVIGELRGRELPDEVVVVGGHLDTWDVGTGAHDDGAGCAIMLAAARLLHKLDLRPRRTIRVVLFVAEEQGGHGGRAYLEAHRDELDHHVAAMESDSGAFAPDGFSVRGEEQIINQINKMAQALKGIGADHVRPGWAGVDIGPIVEAGVPGIGYRVKGEHYFDYHHSPADTFDKIVPEDLANNVAAAAAMMWALAEEGL